MTAFIKSAVTEITESKAIILIIWFLAGQGVFEVVRSVAAIGLIDRNHRAVHRVAEQVDMRTQDRWTKHDMIRLCEKFNEAHPDTPVPLEGLK